MSAGRIFGSASSDRFWPRLPSRGELQVQLQELAAKKWRHPISGEWVLFGLSTIERWYYKALRSKAGPVEALKRKIRSDHGQHPSLDSPAHRTC